jgi:hypothetical protein
VRGAAGPSSHHHPLGLALSCRPFRPVPHDAFRNQNPEFLFAFSLFALSLFPPFLVLPSDFRYSLAIHDSSFSYLKFSTSIKSLADSSV